MDDSDQALEQNALQVVKQGSLPTGGEVVPKLLLINTNSTPNSRMSLAKTVEKSEGKPSSFSISKESLVDDQKSKKSDLVSDDEDPVLSNEEPK